MRAAKDAKSRGRHEELVVWKLVVGRAKSPDEPFDFAIPNFRFEIANVESTWGSFLESEI
jgi:hypothetical protein